MALLVRPTFKENGKKEKLKNKYLYVVTDFSSDDRPAGTWLWYIGEDGCGYHSRKQGKARLIYPGKYWFYLSSEEVKSPMSTIKKEKCLGPIVVEKKKEQEIVLKPHFDIELITDDFDENKLTPYSFDNNRLADSKVEFVYELKSDTEGSNFKADEICFRIIKDGEELFKQEYTGEKDETSELLRPGKHRFEWDGYDNNGILDTTNFKEEGLVFEVLVKKGGEEKKKDFKICVERGDTIHSKIGKYFKMAGYTYSGSVPNETVDWIDLIINKARHKIEILVAIDFQNERNIEPTDSPNFDDLVIMSIEAIKRYWTRSIEIDGLFYRVETKVIRRDFDCVDVDLYVKKSSRFGRSHNTGIIDASFKYLKGYFAERGGKQSADKDFLETAAHEFGHYILEMFGGRKFSWKHKGTSSLGQRVLDDSPSYPMAGEIDLMYYYKGSRPWDFFTRLLVAEDDVKRMLALYSVDFDED